MSRAARCDFAVVGAGMAGASLAAELAAGGARVVMLEAEAVPGYHATGRSAAFWTESYGGPGVQPLTTASGPFLAEHGFLRPRGALTIATAGDEPRLAAFAERYAALGIALIALDRAAIAARIPGLRPPWRAGILEPSCCDIDVAGLHQHYLASARRLGAELHCRAELVAADPASGGWRLTLGDGTRLDAEMLVNAAGAWADAVAHLAGVQPLGIVPLRRTIVELAVTPAPAADLPLVLDLSERFYFKPEGARLWLSPHDESPAPAGDAAPEEVDVATAIARIESVVDWRIDRVVHRWAGLRSFAPDRLPVYGPDPRCPRFVWFAGQGGFGIQTAPAAARLAAAMLLGTSPLCDPGRYAPGRLG
ncbi:MAG: FAD-binding oxidoreductase [Sphingomonadales bacterium]|nr:FAD-binding oxidoreductase [Sphingomonadales bacterium]